MGNVINKTCLFTGLEVDYFIDDRDAWEYNLNVNGHKYFIRLPSNANHTFPNDPYFIENKYLFESFLFNNKWFEDETFIKIESLKNLVAKQDYPKTPKEKLEALFLELFSLQNEDGQLITLTGSNAHIDLTRKLYFRSIEELNYYFWYLVKDELVETDQHKTLQGRKMASNFRITFKGLNKALDLQENGINSNLCFIAMSFKKEANPTRVAIKMALEKTGYKPIIIDEEHLNSDETINDAIIANLKKCNFCIADFSFHSNGVYFESGFALGQGKKVIYTCSEEEFKKAHFDIKPLQHIIYTTPDELEKHLINKIEAWIKS
jgi:hypothetical protein